MYEHNAMGYWLGLALCLTKVRSSRACCPATALIQKQRVYVWQYQPIFAFVFAHASGRFSHDTAHMSTFSDSALNILKNAFSHFFPPKDGHET